MKLSEQPTKSGILSLSIKMKSKPVVSLSKTFDFRQLCETVTMYLILIKQTKIIYKSTYPSTFS